MKMKKFLSASLLIAIAVTVSVSAVSTVGEYDCQKSSSAGHSQLTYSEGGVLWWVGTNTAKTTTKYTSISSYYPLVDAYSYLRYFDYDNDEDVSDYDDYSSVSFGNGSEITLNASIYKRRATHTSTWVTAAHDEDSPIQHSHIIMK